jgi:uncharacterized membrane protein
MKWLKGSLKSLTIWFNGILLALLPFMEYLKDSLPQLQEWLGDDLYRTVGLIVVIGNILLRYKTNKPVSEK